ncbi:MAG: hypothetical protein LC099_01945 [Anaerolineales bacterium]|nr:hypothetical protein [Anaerolineales bacterium]
MKRIFTLTLALLLAACGTVQPAPQEAPTQAEPPTPIVQTIVETVVVVATAQPTDVPPPTPEPPTAEPPTAVPPTAEPPTAEAPTVAPVSPPSNPSDLTPVLVDNMLGKGVFTDVQFSSDRLTLNCIPRDLTVSVRAVNPDTKMAAVYYRMVDVSGNRFSDWTLLSNMDSDGKGNFTYTIQATQLNPDWRVLKKASIDLQFVALNKGGGVIDRTQKIERLVTYYKDCP